MNTTRKFGIEIEAYNCDKRELESALNLAGIKASQSRRLAGDSEDTWRIVRDASISGDDSFELVSPILSGDDGLKQIKKVCKVLKLKGVKVNQTCGLHVHLDARNMSVNNVKSVLTRYINNEDIIDSFMPQSRREDNNRYCRSVIHEYEKSQAFRILESCPTIRQIAETFASRNRYVKLNVQSYLQHGSIEFRQHSGTIEANKIVNWINFCQQFVDGAIAGNIDNNGSFRERFDKLLSPAPDAITSTTLKGFKQAVMSALNLTTTAQVKAYAKQHNLSLDLRCKASWQAILTALPTANNAELNQINTFYRARMARLGTDSLLVAS